MVGQACGAGPGRSLLILYFSIDLLVNNIKHPSVFGLATRENRERRDTPVRTNSVFEKPESGTEAFENDWQLHPYPL